MSRLNAELSRIARLPADRQMMAYRNAHTLLLKREPGNYPDHEHLLKAFLQAEHAIKGPNERLTGFAAALEIQGRHMRRSVVFAGFLNNSGNVLRTLHRLNEALVQHEEALQIRRTALAPKSLGTKPGVAH